MDSPPATAAPWTVARLLAWTREHFERRGIESPRLCAEILLAHALQCERLRLFTQHDVVPSEPALARFRDHVQQAAAGRPIAYLTGTRDFFSLPFAVTPDVLIPRPETEVLVERTIDLARKSGPAGASILDLGTGSGCIAIALARHLADARLFASDVSEAALSVARRNAAAHRLAERVTFAAGDLFDAWPADARWDIIVSNPPYVALSDPHLAPNVRDNEPHAALYGGPDGLAVIRRIATAAPAVLNRGGAVLLEAAFNQAAAVRGLLAAAGFREIVTFRDPAGHERVTQARTA